MKNYVQLGDNLTLPAPYSVTSGDGALIGAIFGVASTTQFAGEDTSFVRIGVFNLTKAAGTAWAVGQKLYWDNGAKNVTATAGGTLIGAAATAALAADTSGAVLLSGQVT